MPEITHKKRTLNFISSRFSPPPQVVAEKRVNIARVAVPIIEAAAKQNKEQKQSLEKQQKQRLSCLQKQFKGFLEQAEEFNATPTLIKQIKRSIKSLSVPADAKVVLTDVLIKGKQSYDDLLFIFGKDLNKGVDECLYKICSCQREVDIYNYMFDTLKNCKALSDRREKALENIEAIKAELEELREVTSVKELLDKSKSLIRINSDIEYLDKEISKINEFTVGLKRYYQAYSEPGQLNLYSQKNVILEVDRADVTANPYRHLALVYTSIETNKNFLGLKNLRLYIRFKGEEGQDEGGLLQEYMNLLFKGLCTKPDGSRRSLFEQPDSQDIHKHLSLVLRYVYEKSNLYTGHYIDVKDLNVLFGFPSEIMSSTVLKGSAMYWAYKDKVVKEFLNPRSMIAGMVRAIIATLSKSEQSSYLSIMNALTLKEPLECTEEMLENIFALDGEVPEKVLALKDTNEKKFLLSIKYKAIDVIKEVLQRYKKPIGSLLHAFTFIEESFVKKINSHMEASYAKKAVLAFANKFYLEGVGAVNRKIQGKTNRKDIMDRIQIKGLETSAFKQKIVWFRQWAATASKEEWEAFLIFATGANCDYSTGLTFQSVNNSLPLLCSHTCFGTIDFNNSFIVGHDDTKERFIAKVKESISIESFTFL